MWGGWRGRVPLGIAKWLFLLVRPLLSGLRQLERQVHMRSTTLFTVQKLDQIEKEAGEAGDQRTVLLCRRARGDSVKVIAARRKATLGCAQADREIRTLLSPEECRGQWACVSALLAAFPQ